jgi:hypothetical protein
MWTISLLWADWDFSCPCWAVPAGIYAKVHYGTSLSNVDWLHGGAESLLTLTNLFIVIGLRKAIREAVEDEEKVIAEEEKDVPLLKWNAGDCLII